MAAQICDRSVKFKEIKSDRELEREIKEAFFCWKNSMEILKRCRENEKCSRLGDKKKKVKKNKFDDSNHKTCN